MQTTVAKGVAMSKFCSDPNKNAIFFISFKVLIEKIFEYDQGENKDHILSIFQIWQNLLFYRKILCKTTLLRTISGRYAIYTCLVESLRFRGCLTTLFIYICNTIISDIRCHSAHLTTFPIGTNNSIHCCITKH